MFFTEYRFWRPFSRTPPSSSPLDDGAISQDLVGFRVNFVEQGKPLPGRGETGVRSDLK
jgi:hypothetical protein